MKPAKWICRFLLLCLLVIQSPAMAEQLHKHQTPSLLRPVAQMQVSNIPKGLAVYHSMSDYLAEHLASSPRFIKLQDLVSKLWFAQRRKKR